MTLERSEAFEAALSAMESSDGHVFVTGRAGTGKSTLLRQFRLETKRDHVVLAPTGIAALNVGGETIHRFFKFAPGVTLKEAIDGGRAAREERVYRATDVLIIDEVSMVRADLLDAMDLFLRNARGMSVPFGGVKVVFIGDLLQLPPVVRRDEQDALREVYPTPFFFSSNVFRELMDFGAFTTIQLEKVYRQRDAEFLQLLNAIRDGRVDPNVLQALNACYQPTKKTPKEAIVLTATNAQADAINATRMRGLKSKGRTYSAMISGRFSERDLPTDAELTLKKGARVMFVQNDTAGRWVNGTLGTVEAVEEEGVDVAIDDGATVRVEPSLWNLSRSVYDVAEGALGRETLGSFRQIPLTLAWATTIHKSQGKTFDQVVIDLGAGAFAAGQTYVALSRSRSLDGIRLLRPLRATDIRTDPTVSQFIRML